MSAVRAPVSGGSPAPESAAAASGLSSSASRSIPGPYLFPQAPDLDEPENGAANEAATGGTRLPSTAGDLDDATGPAHLAISPSRCDAAPICAYPDRVRRRSFLQLGL